jgi:hypothetical protein
LDFMVWRPLSAQALANFIHDFRIKVAVDKFKRHQCFYIATQKKTYTVNLSVRIEKKT